MGCGSILPKPQDAEMGLIISMKARSEAIEHLGLLLICYCNRLSTLMPEPKGAMTSLILDAHHVETLYGRAWSFCSFSVICRCRTATSFLMT